jgi:hypothetical protein
MRKPVDSCCMALDWDRLLEVIAFCAINELTFVLIAEGMKFLL